MGEELIQVETGNDNVFPKTTITDSEGKARFQVEYGDYVVYGGSDDYFSKPTSVQFRRNHKNFTIPMIEWASVMRLQWEASIEPTVGFNGDDGFVLSDGATATIDWGDGTVSSYTQASDFAHTYEDDGFYEIIIIPEGGHIIGLSNSLFRFCEGLAGVMMPSTITSVGGGAFDGCTNLVQVQLSSSLTEIKSGTFNKCTSLQYIDLPNGITTIDGGAFQKCGLLSMEFPQTLTLIDVGAFSDCSFLSAIYLPEGLTTIKSGCFAGTGLRNVVIPSTVTTLEGGSFSISSLASVEFLSTTPPTMNGAFIMSSTMTVTVPKGTLQAYTSALSSYHDITIIEKE